MRSAGQSGAHGSYLQDYGIICNVMAQTGAGRGRSVQAIFAISALNVSVAELAGPRYGTPCRDLGYRRGANEFTLKRRARTCDPGNDCTLR
jgi:hypothetical protein